MRCAHPFFKYMKEADVCNMALAKLGQSMISQTSYDEARKGSQNVDPVSRACASLYDASRKEALCAVRWSFAIRSANLCLLPDGACDVPQGYQAAYQIPSSCIRLLDVPLRKWALMGRRIVAHGNAECLEVTYVNDERNVDLFDPLFTDALATLLASKLAGPVTGSTRLREGLLAEYTQVILPKAAYINKVQDQSNDQHPLNDILNRGLRR